MAYQTVATRWLLGKKDQIDVSFVEHKWNIGPSFPYTDIEVLIRLDDKHTVTGRGTDLVGDIALEKASSEAIERWCCHILNISTVGCAVHSHRESAELNSKNEFAERFAFNKLKSKDIKPKALQSKKTQELFGNLAKFYPGSEVLFFELVTFTPDKTVLCLILDENTPISLGLALEAREDSAVQKSFTEALRNYVSYKTDASLFFNSIQKSMDFWCCNPEFLNQLLGLIKMDVEISSVAMLKPITKTLTRSISEIVQIADCPLFFSMTTEGLGAP